LGEENITSLAIKGCFGAKIPLCVPPNSQPNIPRREKKKKKNRERNKETEWKLIDWGGSDKNRRQWAFSKRAKNKLQGKIPTLFSLSFLKF
jgi:hypothetical protein